MLAVLLSFLPPFLSRQLSHVLLDTIRVLYRGIVPAIVTFWAESILDKSTQHALAGGLPL